MSKKFKVMCGLGLVFAAPMTIYLAYLERGYWAFGGEYGVMFVLLFAGTQILSSLLDRESVKK